MESHIFGEQFVRILNRIGDKASISVNYSTEVELASMLTLAWPYLPEKVKEIIEVPWYTPEAKLEANLSSNDKNEWKEVYQALRDLGWEREKFYPVTAEFKGIRYLMKLGLHNEGLTKGTDIKLLLSITFDNCETKLVGTKIVEVPIYSIVCGEGNTEKELVDIAPEEEETSEVLPDLVMEDKDSTLCEDDGVPY